MSIKVANEVRAYREAAGAFRMVACEQPMVVRSYVFNNMVELTIGTEKIIVNARDLEAALRNATNTGMV